VKELLKASLCQEIAKFVCKIAFFGINSTLQQRINHISTPAAMGVQLCTDLNEGSLMDLQLSQNLNIFFGSTVPAQVFISSLASRVVTIGNSGFMVFLIIGNGFWVLGDKISCTLLCVNSS
jgi:hypothetical protein